ncbi:cupin domain-containing protein [Geomesophilobacter sediminis]|uniref:Cupin domain-containing protein n=1 Tax=Geomesophilobacter sediminis TaxID=2798584 RepID=A0A8J7LZ15_9BACT|nr:cupin domain-containing protein [Geomesophilobacter sediminis]MBJ6725917.1 cupin domain-containing protein [Geomesophilobacter sediminis]
METILTAQALIERYRLLPHPEGGYYREVHRSEHSLATPAGYPGERVALTAIYFLLEEGDFSALHTVRSEEVWVHLAGAPLELVLLGPELERRTLSAPGEDGEPLTVVPPEVLQGARSLGEYTLVSCLVAPGFDFDDFRIPPRAELIAGRPEAEEVITRFTRG